MSSYIETPEYAKAVRRQLRAYAERVGDADDVDLATMVEILEELETLVGEAAERISWRQGWAYVAAGVGMTPQGARQKFYVRRLAKKKAG